MNKLLIPFLFFYLLGCACYYMLKWIAPGLLVTSAGGILDLFNNRQYFNGPIWFLLCLFWCNLIFGIISLHVHSEALRIIIVCVLGTVGYWLGYYGTFVPLFVDVALTALPFFIFGYYLKRSNLLYPTLLTVITCCLHSFCGESLIYYTATPIIIFLCTTMRFRGGLHTLFLLFR